MIEYIIKSFKKRDIELDSGQLALLYKMVESVQPEKDITSKLENNSVKKSFYIWGDVGRGKTLITKAFVNLLTERKASFHYMEFMQKIHNELSGLQGKKNPLNILARSVSRDYKLIFIDEFQVEDITDAMIVGNLINQLIKLKVTIYLTSNAHPDDLYKEGLQRDIFINEMRIMQESLMVHEIKGKLDYRSRNIVNLNYDNLNKDYNDNDIILFLKNNFENLCFNKEFHVNSRSFSCKATSSDFLWISFSEFFKESGGDREYIEISENTEWIFINDFMICNDESADIIRRFISFVDICYRNRTKIKFFFNNNSSNELYSGDKLIGLWHRCISRLNEMQTVEYLT